MYVHRTGGAPKYPPKNKRESSSAIYNENGNLVTIGPKYGPDFTGEKGGRASVASRSTVVEIDNKQGSRQVWKCAGSTTAASCLIAQIVACVNLL